MMGEKGRIRRRILALAGMVPALVALPAQAQPREHGPFDVVGVGLFVGYTFGEERGIDWGVEGFATRFFRDVAECGDNDERTGFGPLLRLSALNVSRFSVTGAGHIGGEAARSFAALDLELGGSLALSRDGSLGSVHTGLTLESIIFNVYARQEWLLKSYSVGGGARFFPTYGSPGFCEVGRAFRDGQGDPQSLASCVSASFDGRSSEAVRWAERSRDECASIFSFLQLALELLDEGAPLSLVARAVRAAEQELSHTWAAAMLASRYGGAPVVARAPTPRFRARLAGERQLARLARESWVDGCLNEGLAALIASVEAIEVKRAPEARVCAQIASDEAEHASLGFDVLRWAIARDERLAPDAPQPQGSVVFGSPSLRDEQLRELSALHASRAQALLVRAHDERSNASVA